MEGRTIHKKRLNFKVYVIYIFKIFYTKILKFKINYTENDKEENKETKPVTDIMVLKTRHEAKQTYK